MRRKLALYISSILGIVIGTYLTYARYNLNSLACPEYGIINCGSVITSQFSQIIGVPTSVLAVVLFILAPFMLTSKKDHLPFLWMVAGAGAILYSLGAQFLLGLVCLYCLLLDIIIFSNILIAQKPKGKSAGLDDPSSYYKEKKSMEKGAEQETKVEEDEEAQDIKKGM